MSDSIVNRTDAPTPKVFGIAAWAPIVRVLSAVKGLLESEYTPTYFDWHFDAHDDSKRLHNLYTFAVWSRKPLYALAATLLWPPKLLGFTIRRCCQFGSAVNRIHGVSVLQQFVDQLYLGLRYAVPPRSYYLYRLFAPGKRNQARKYIMHHEIIELLSLSCSGHDTSVFDDKRRFCTACCNAGLPTPTIICELQRGTVSPIQKNRKIQLPPTDLFAKPAFGVGGYGIYSYTFESEGQYRDHRSQQISSEQIIDELSDASNEEPYILQQRLHNHRDLNPISNGALCTLRVVTYRLPGQLSQFLIGVLKMPTGDAQVSQASAGGLASPVDPSSGLLGLAAWNKHPIKLLDKHPDTGITILGRKVPCFDTAMELCLKAHIALSEIPTIGWDIAITDNGPTLLEGNAIWGSEVIQCALDRPLGDTALASCLLGYRYR